MSDATAATVNKYDTREAIDTGINNMKLPWIQQSDIHGTKDVFFRKPLNRFEPKLNQQGLVKGALERAKVRKGILIFASFLQVRLMGSS